MSDFQGMYNQEGEIRCPLSDKVIWKVERGPNGQPSRYITEFTEHMVIGAGGFGCVCYATNNLDGEAYAVKKIVLMNNEEQDFDHVIREVKALSKLDHPNVVRYFSSWIESELSGLYQEPGDEEGSLFDFKIPNGPCLYIQQELCSSSLSTELSAGPMAEDRIWNIFKNIISGLEHIHDNNIRHGDLSPNNIFFDNKQKVKIGDFGLASLISDGFLGPNSPKASGVYSAPELENGQFSLSSDLYSLGIILLDMLIGTSCSTNMEKISALYKFKTSKELPPGISDMGREVITTLTIDDPSDRMTISDLISWSAAADVY